MKKAILFLTLLVVIIVAAVLILKKDIFTKVEPPDTIEKQYIDIRNENLRVKTEQSTKDNETVEFDIYAVDEKGDVFWNKTWNKLVLTELPVASPYTIYKEMIIIEVGGDLFSLDLFTGNVLWQAGGVGACIHAPVIDPENGAIYVSGYDTSFITAVNPDGSIKWRKDSPSQGIYWPTNIEIKENQIIVTAEQARCIYDKLGNFIKTEGVPENTTPPPEYEPLRPGTSYSMEDGYHDYEGTINGNIRIQMSLYPFNNEVKGTYLYEKVGQYLRLEGRIEGQNIILKEYDSNGNNTGQFSGIFTSADSIEGTWSDSSVKYPFKLSLKAVLPGTKYGNRYGMISNNDAEVETFAQSFKNYINTNDKGNVAAMIYYPISVSINGRITIINNKDEFINNYDKIITQQLKSSISKSFPKYMFVNWQGVMFGSGGENVWINPFEVNGRSKLHVMTINNGESSTSTSGESQAVTISSITASSFLKEATITHNPEKVCDNNRSTAWVEGASGDGIGEYVQLNFNGNKTISTVKLINGYSKSNDLYYKNNRMKKVKLVFSDGSSAECNLQDNILDYQSINLSRPINTSYVKIIILEVYKGNKYTDTCISEVSFN